MAFKVLICVCILLLFLFIAQPSLQLSPFRFSMKTPFYSLGWLLIGLGVAFISYSERKDARAEEHQKINGILEQFIKQKKQEEVSNEK